MISQKGLSNVRSTVKMKCPLGPTYRLGINVRLLDLVRFKFATAAILIFKFSSI